MIKRKRKAKRESTVDHFLKLIESNRFNTLDLTDQWDDTVVKKVFISFDVTIQINNWVNKSLIHRPVPEVGGFLWGNYTSKNRDDLWISFEYFEAAKETESQSSVRLDFGTKVLQEMDEKKDLYEAMILIGWFHTHPGHTPYLSRTDLTLHNGFFLEPFQVAVVLDSLTDQFETGLFSRKKNKEVNNKETIKKWEHWKGLVELTKV